jgi:Glycosyl hydrolases family 38 C-terminal domain
VTLVYLNCIQGTNATVKARLYFDDPVIEWDIRTEEIPVSDMQGKEITVNFASKEIVNSGIFYTDSNGLEMQRRVLPFKQGAATVNNVSASFYAVSSAIALKDTESESFEQLTVMTTRTQGASAIKESRIELMHARRLLFDDRISKEIVLNDTDLGAATQSTYYVQLYDRQYEHSLQR